METLIISVLIFSILVFAGAQSDKKFNKKCEDIKTRITRG